MSQFKLIETKSSNGKDYYIEGYVSTIDPDFVNDIVDESGQIATHREIIGSDITMDEDHNEWRNPKTGKLYESKKNLYPIARIIDAKLDKKGTWVKAKLNKYHPEFEIRILPMIKDRFLHSFSIAYKVTKAISRIINNVKYRIIQDLKIANIAITGNPINKDATFNIALKSFNKKMDEEIKQEETQVEDNSTEVKSDMDYKKMYEEMKSKYTSLKAEYDKMTSSKKDDEKKDTEMKSFNEELINLKSKVENLEKENTELKSFVESPQLKSIVEGKSKVPEKPEEVKKVSVWDVI